MTEFAISDLHFNHGNTHAHEPKSGIMKFCPKTRPYSTKKEMNEHLIESWNSVVKRGDIVRFLGDFAFRSTQEEIEYFFNALNGQKYLYRGNHDHKEVRRLPWAGVYYGDVFMRDGVKFHLNHHPFAVGQWDSAHHGSIHLFGHVHGAPVPGYEVPVRALDVGVDSIGPVPLSLDEIAERMKKIPVVVNHHPSTDRIRDIAKILWVKTGHPESTFDVVPETHPVYEQAKAIVAAGL